MGCMEGHSHAVIGTCCCRGGSCPSPSHRAVLKSFPSWIQTPIATQPERWGHLRRVALRGKGTAFPSRTARRGRAHGAASAPRSPRLTGLHLPNAISPGSYSAPINLPPTNYQPRVFFFDLIRQIWWSNVLSCVRTKLGQGHIKPIPESMCISAAHTQPVCLSIAPIKWSWGFDRHQLTQGWEKDKGS